MTDSTPARSMRPSARMAKLDSRLSGYWKIELANVVLIPVMMIVYANMKDQALSWLSFLTMGPMMALLIVGGLYWRAKLHSLRGNPATLARFLPMAQRLKRPLCLLSLASLGLVVAAWTVPDLSASLGDRVVTTIAGVLAALEYVNYYHRQLQHFDHMADFRRLITGRGFRPSQMAMDLKRVRDA